MCLDYGCEQLRKRFENVAMSVHDLDVFSQHVLLCLWCFIFLFFLKNYAFLIIASPFSENDQSNEACL